MTYHSILPITPQKALSMARLFSSSALLLISALLPLLGVGGHEAWPGSFTCPPTQTLSPRVNASGVCDCAAGWVGPECGICTSDEACASIEGEGSRCSQTSFAGEKKLVRSFVRVMMRVGRPPKQEKAKGHAADGDNCYRYHLCFLPQCLRKQCK